MTTLTVSEAVIHSLNGDGIVSGRDENGIYALCDRIELLPSAGVANFYSKKVKVGTMPLSPMTTGDTLTLSGIEARIRLLPA